MLSRAEKVAVAASILVMAASIAFSLTWIPERTGRILLSTLPILVLTIGCLAHGLFKGRLAPALLRASEAHDIRAAEERLRVEHEERVAALIAECKPPPFEPSEAERVYVLRSLKPGIVLLNLAARAAGEQAFSDGRIVDEIYFDRTGNSPSRAERARLEAHKIARREWFEADPEFRAAIRRLGNAGVTYEFGGQGDYCGEFAVLRLHATAAALPRLERLAADAAGFRTREQRAEAAERFRIYMLRNYGKDWERNREIYPDLGSPYLDARPA